ncbi:MAG: phage tail tube protein, partial [Oscillospiraceae bacterium]
MYLKAEDTVSGKEARAQIIIGGKVQELFYAKKVEATIEKNKAEINTIGNRGTGHKTNGWNGTGSMTIYYVTSLFREKIIEYIKTGRDFYFDLVGT